MPTTASVKIHSLITAVFLLFAIPLLAQLPATTGEERIRAMELRKQLQDDSLINAVAFRNIGPSIMSGRVTDLDVNPEDPTEFYVAYSTGGIWHTLNNGQSFTPIMDSLHSLFVGDIAVNWKTNPRIIWVGTGEVNSSRSSYAGTGVYKTTDNGKSWQYLGLPESHHIGKIEIDINNPLKAWVAVQGHLYTSNAERGVYLTADGGKSWKHTLFVNNETGCVDLAMSPYNSNIIYAALWQRSRKAWEFKESGPASGIYRSMDGGLHWEKVSGPNSGFMQGDKIGRIGLYVRPGNDQFIYAVVDNNTPLPAKENKTDSTYSKEIFKDISSADFAKLDNAKIDSFLKKNRFPKQYTAAQLKEKVANGSLSATALWDWLDSDDGFQNTGIVGCEVYISENGGTTWRKTNEKPIGIFSTYGYYFAKIYASTINPDKIFILGITLQISIDGGKTFTTLDKPNVHADHHALWINPRKDSHIINGNDGGVNISYDDGKNWFKANTPAVGQFYAITVDDAKPYNVYGGLQDNGSWWGPSTHKENINWTEDGQYAYRNINGGDGMQVQVDKRDNATIYSGSQFGFYGRYQKDKKGANKFIKPQHTLGEKPLRFNWQTPILLSKHQPDIFYYGSNKFHRSLNKGDTLITLSTDLTKGKVKGNVPYGTITTIDESPLQFGLLYVGTDDGQLHRSADAGNSWNSLNLSTTVTISSDGKKTTKKISTQGLDTKKLWVSRVIASQHFLNRVYVTLNGYRMDHFNPYVFVSEDGGQSWKNISGNLPLEPVNVIREDPTNSKILYVGTDGGLYVSMDNGLSYKAWQAGMPNSIAIHDIAIQPRENEIVLGTHGRSLYIAKLDKIQEAAKKTTIKKLFND